MKVEVQFGQPATFTAIMGGNQAAFESGMEESIRVSVSDHTKLTNRDVPDQHPMGSITGLDTSLGAKVSAADALTNLEIEAILGGS